MMNPLPPDNTPELFAERPVHSEEFAQDGLSYRARRIITVCVLVAATAVGLYWAFGRNAPAPGEIPLIKAEAGDIKHRPQNPGGVDIPHQDVEAYQLIGKQTAGSQPEHLLPSSETPEPSAIMAAAPSAPSPASPDNTPAATAPASASPGRVNLVPSPTAPKIATTIMPEPAYASKAPLPAAGEERTTVNLVNPPEAKKPEAKTEAAKTPAAKTASPQPTMKQVLEQVAAGKEKSSAKALAAKAVAGKEAVIQLASVSDEAGAEKMAAQLQVKYASLLGSAKLRVVKADLGAKGVYYRIQSQPVSSQSAGQICLALKNRAAGCIVVRR